MSHKQILLSTFYIFRFYFLLYFNFLKLFSMVEVGSCFLRLSILTLPPQKLHQVPDLNPANTSMQLKNMTDTAACTVCRLGSETIKDDSFLPSMAFTQLVPFTLISNLCMPFFFSLLSTMNLLLQLVCKCLVKHRNFHFNKSNAQRNIE